MVSDLFKNLFQGLLWIQCMWLATLFAVQTFRSHLSHKKYTADKSIQRKSYKESFLSRRTEEMLSSEFPSHADHQSLSGKTFWWLLAPDSLPPASKKCFQAPEPILLPLLLSHSLQQRKQSHSFLGSYSYLDRFNKIQGKKLCIENTECW